MKTVAVDVEQVTQDVAEVATPDAVVANVSADSASSTAIFQVVDTAMVGAPVIVMGR